MFAVYLFLSFFALANTDVVKLVYRSAVLKNHCDVDKFAAITLKNGFLEKEASDDVKKCVNRCYHNLENCKSVVYYSKPAKVRTGVDMYEDVSDHTCMYYSNTIYNGAVEAEEISDTAEATLYHIHGCEDESVSANRHITNLPDTPLKFEDCWIDLKSRDLTEEKKKVVQQQRELQQEKESKSRFKNWCCVKLPSYCKTSLDGAMEEERLIILALAKVQFSEKDQLHLGMLTSLYKSCSSSSAHAPKRYGSHWEYIGFQGTDPATDLRGAGIFGLFQLVAFATDSRNHAEVRALMDLSQDTVQNFPFAIVGINISKFVLTSLKKGCLNRLCKKRKSVISVVNDLYKGAFCLFYNIWLHGRKNIEHSGFVLKKIERKAIKQPRKLLRQKMDLKKWRQTTSEQQQQETSLTFHSI